MVTGGNFSNLQLSAAGIFFGVAAGFLYSLVTIIEDDDKFNYRKMVEKNIAEHLIELPKTKKIIFQDLYDELII